MFYKSADVEKEFKASPLLLQLMAHEFEAASQSFFNIQPIMTRIMEHICGDSGVHEDGRACDFRDESDGKRLYTDDQVEQLLEYMNFWYERNDGKPTMIHHSFAGGPKHFHLQISAFTKAYTPGKSVSPQLWLRPDPKLATN